MIQHIENQDNTLFQNSKKYNAVHNVLTYRGCEIKGAFHSITFTNGYSCCSLVTNSLMESFNGQRHGGAREELLGKKTQNGGWRKVESPDNNKLD